MSLANHPKLSHKKVSTHSSVFLFAVFLPLCSSEGEKVSDFWYAWRASHWSRKHCQSLFAFEVNI